MIQNLKTAKGALEYFRFLWAHQYSGPIVIAGGFARDTALGLPAKDLDVFLLEDPSVDFRAMADNLVGSFMFGARITNVINGYREWSEDVHQVYQVAVPEGLPYESIDIIILKVGAPGYTGTWKEAHFLKAVVDRVDLRLNCIGHSFQTSVVHVEWVADVEAKRLVVQACRVNPEDRPRQQRRLDRLTAPGAKFEGWSCWEEQADGSLAPWVSA